MGLDTGHRFARRATTPRAVSATLPRAVVASAAVPATAMAQAAVTPAFAPGAAYTGRPVNQAIPTTPPSTGKDLNTVALTAYAPTFAAIRTDYVPVQQLPVGPYNPGPFVPSLASGKSTVFSQKTIIIIAAAGGGGVALAILLGSWWCWRKRETKRKEGNWWRLNAEHSAGPTIGKPRARVDSKEHEMDKVDYKFREKEWGAGRTMEDDHFPPELSYAQTFGSPEQVEGNASSAREELLGSSRGGERKKHAWSTAALSDVISFRSPSAQSLPRTPQPTTPHRSPLPATSPNRSPFDDSNAGYPFPVRTPSPPRRPIRHSDAVTEPYFGRVHDDKDLPGSEGLDDRFMEMMRAPAQWDQDSKVSTSRNPKQNGRQDKVDTIMDFTDGYGRYTDDDDPSMPSFGGQNAWGQANSDQPIPRAVSRSPQPTFPPDADLSRQLYANTIDMDSFPPPPPSVAAGRQRSRYSRVDSRPLHELEGILESFAYKKNSSSAPPSTHGSQSLRTLSVSSQFTVAPLTIKRNPSQASQSTSHPMPDRNRRPVTNPYAGRESVYTDGGDLGGLVAFNGHPTSPPPLPSHSPATNRRTPSLHSRNNSQANRSQRVYDSSEREELTPSPMETHVVRRVSLKRGADAPVRLHREGSSSDQHQRSKGQQQQRRPGYPQDDVPRTDSRGFIPLAAMSTLEPGSYRSATESMYGMYYD